MRIKARGRSSIEVIDDAWINVYMNNNGYVELRIEHSRLEDAKAVQEKLRSAGYNAELRGHDDGFEIYINHDEIMRHPELLAKVCEILRGIYEEAMSEGKYQGSEKDSKGDGQA